PWCEPDTARRLMSLDLTEPIPPTVSKAPDTKLIRNIRELCSRIVRGKAAVQNRSVWLQRLLGGASIVLSSLGSVGVIADKSAGNLPTQSGWAFWGSVILLVFGILSQIANQFSVAQRAADSEALAVRCGLYETRLTDMLILDDPQTEFAGLFVEVSTLFQSERYNVVLPRETTKMKDDATKLADDLIARYQPFWSLKVRKVKGATRRAATLSRSGVAPTVNTD